GWIRLLGEQFGFYQREFGVSLSVVTSMVLFTILIWWTSRRLNQLDLQHQQTERAVRASEEKFRALAQTANDGIISADNQGDILFINPGAEAIFGYSAAELIGQPLTVLMPERFHEAHQRGLERFLLTGQAHVIGR